jgi:hypothetical protein
VPDEQQLLAMRLVAKMCFEPCREKFGRLFVSSFFRSKRLNEEVGGSVSSQHMKGEAIDIDADVFGNKVTNVMLYNYIKKNLEFDQLIWEYGSDVSPAWVHVSYKLSGNRGQEKRIW